MILSDGLWRRRFAANPEVLGSSVRLNDRAYQVIGVMPAAFSFPGRAELWLPRNRSDAQSNAYILARLRPTVGLALAQADMEAMVTAITNGRPNPGMRFTVEPLKQAVIGSAASSWFLLLAAVGCVLVIGCVNVSNLMLARGLRRRREIDIRLALGASRGHVVRLLATESLLLASIGGVLALGVASWSIHALRMWAPGDTPRLNELSVEPMMLWVAMGLSMLTALAFGLVPALQCSRSDVVTSLQVLRHCGDRDSRPLADARCPRGDGNRAFAGAVGRSNALVGRSGAADERRPRLSDRPSAHGQPAPAASKVLRSQRSGWISSRGH